MVIFLAALQAVPKEYYEAASIDGLNGVQKFFKITLPEHKRDNSFFFSDAYYRRVQHVYSDKGHYGWEPGSSDGSSPYLDVLPDF